MIIVWGCLGCAILSICYYVWQLWHGHAHDLRFLLSARILIAFLMAYLLNQPTVTQRVNAHLAWLHMNAALGIGQVIAMYAAYSATFFFLYILQGEHASQTFRRWALFMWLITSVIAFTALHQAGPLVTITGTLSSHQFSAALMIEHFAYLFYQIAMEVQLTTLFWRAFQTTQDIGGKVTFTILLIGQVGAAVYLAFGLFKLASGYPTWAITLSGRGINVMAFCYLIGSLSPLVMRHHISTTTMQRHIALLIACIRIAPLWRDLTRHIPGVRYTTLSWLAAWRHADQLQVAAYRYVLEITNAIQVTAASAPLSIPPVDTTEQMLSDKDRIMLDVYCCRLILQPTRTPHEQTLIQNFPHFESDDIDQTIAYFEVMAHYYMRIYGPLWRRFLEAIVEPIIWRFSLARTLSSTNEPMLSRLIRKERG
jgi:hypothetical protein